ncbi:MAG: hypothetical protein OQK78_12550 [Gammaproteobacteria bacterium]|nr:hypothetical protein [Gammaproteobacteria bacterium]
MNREDHQDPAISKLYQSRDKATPSADIDAAIMAQAKESIAHRAVSKQRSQLTWLRWLVPLSTAALVVMGVSITIKIMNQPDSSYLQIAPTAEPAFESSYDHEKSLKDEAFNRPSSSSPQPAEVMMFEAMPETIQEADVIKQEQQATPVREKKSASPKVGAASTEREERQRSILKRSIPNAMGVMKIKPDAVNRDLSDAMGMAQEETAEIEKEWINPEEWLNHIKLLVDKNKKEEARIEFERFRESYPNYLIPEDLLDLLG